ncbi:MAG: hypothetical protein F7C35_00285 [Desulfurococcales archaeon]|nr:hypothetical protein [Desulfurococcales archaeon]
MSEGAVFKVKAGEKEIELDEHVLSVLQRYVKTEMTLEELAAELGLKDWEEAYEFVKNIPAWILWIQPTLWKTLKAMKSVKEEYVKPGKK